MAESNNSETSNIKEECPICLGSLAQQGLDVFTTACQHKFHFQCLVNNIQAQNNECPLCRTRLDSLVSILSSSSNSPVSMRGQQTQVQVVPPVPTTQHGDSGGVWATLSRSISNVFSSIYRGWSRPASSTNRHNSRPSWNVSHLDERKNEILL